jgi:hypothetical protein
LTKRAAVCTILANVNAYYNLALGRWITPEGAKLIDAFEGMAAWEGRIQVIGHGHRSEMCGKEALEIAGKLTSSSAQHIAIKRNDPLVGDVTVHFPLAGFFVVWFTPVQRRPPREVLLERDEKRLDAENEISAPSIEGGIGFREGDLGEAVEQLVEEHG